LANGNNDYNNLLHVFGSGFPKSANVSVMIDKHLGNERERLGTKYDLLGHGRKKDTQLFGEGRNWMNNENAEAHFVTAPASPEAKQWDGWGSATKPAHELWWLVRKPLGEPTIAANVLRHGTGGLNPRRADHCRECVTAWDGRA